MTVIIVFYMSNFHYFMLHTLLRRVLLIIIICLMELVITICFISCFVYLDLLLFLIDFYNDS